MTVPVFTSYCLGNGAPKCDGCQQEKNWQLLNQFDDALRLPMQQSLKRISDTQCILLGRPWYQNGEQDNVTSEKG